MFRVGLTGGIASGKTTVANLLKELGAGLVDTDAVAREVVALGEPGLEAVTALFGPGILFESGELNRGALRAIVFRDEEKRRELESILHPLIRARTLGLIDELDAPYAVIVVPLLVETAFDEIVDRVLVVDCPLGIQRERLMRRDKMSAAEATSMLAAQADRETRNARADDLLDNSGDLAAIRNQVNSLHGDYLRRVESHDDGD